MHNELRFYVYAYLRSDGSPYYVGKGCGKRFLHTNRERYKAPENRNRIVFLEKNLSELGALALERRMIRWYGRKDIGTGILRNLTDGGDGTSGHVHSAEARRKISATHSGRPKSKAALTKRAISRAGWKPSTAARQNMSVGQLGRVHSKESIASRAEKRQKAYVITMPDKTTSEIFGLNKFARENGLSASKLCHMASGRISYYRGYQVERLCCNHQEG